MFHGSTGISPLESLEKFLLGDLAVFHKTHKKRKWKTKR